MYINVDLLRSKSLSPEYLLVLQMCKQSRTENQTQVLEHYAKYIPRLVESEFIKLIGKKKKSDSDFRYYRITKSGTKLLEDLQTPEVTEEDLVLYDWMKNQYLKQGKDLGNQKRTKICMARFRQETHIEKNCLAELLQTFLHDGDNMEYNHNLQFAFWKPATAFDTKFDLGQCRLYTYFQKNKEYFLRKFKELDPTWSEVSH